MSGTYRPADEAESIAAIHAALDAGISLLDTAATTAWGTRATHPQRRREAGDRDGVVISVKFGALRGPDNAFLGIDGRPVDVKNSLAYPLRRLGTDHFDIYRLGRVNPAAIAATRRRSSAS
jgi:aryl-alcohol dehydrogenase-like predicted oxidoreductase